MPIKASDYILPLVVGKKNTENPFAQLNRFVGTAFYIGANGVIATCGHIASTPASDESLMAYDLNLQRFLKLEMLQIHPEMDFAIARTGVKQNKYLRLVKTDMHPIELGTGISSFGYVNAGRVGADLRLEDKYFKGYISFIGTKPDTTLKCRTVCELSFPTLNGFSGAPVFFENKNSLVGMLYGNRESEIEVYSNTMVEIKGKAVTKKYPRSMALGLMHTVNDIVTFLAYMGIKIKGG